MAVALELFIVAVLGSLFIFVVLEARPPQRMNEWLLRVSGDLEEDGNDRQTTGNSDP